MLFNSLSPASVNETFPLSEYQFDLYRIVKIISLVLAVVCTLLAINHYVWFDNAFLSLSSLMHAGVFLSIFVTRPKHPNALTVLRILLLLTTVSYLYSITALIHQKSAYLTLTLSYFLLFILPLNYVFFRNRERKLRLACDLVALMAFIIHFSLFVTPTDRHLAALLPTLLFAVTAFTVVVTMRKLATRKVRSLAHAYHQNKQLIEHLFPSISANEGLAWQYGNTSTMQNCCVIFADLQGYTKLSATFDDEEVVAILHQMYAEFDRLAQRHGVIKIKTNGDEYMALVGMHGQVEVASTPTATVKTACLFAIELKTSFYRLCHKLDLPCDIRIGIASGDVTGGVIGADKPMFDIWGKTVNTAARLEQSAAVGTVHLCPSTLLAASQIFAPLEPNQWVQGVDEPRLVGLPLNNDEALAHHASPNQGCGTLVEPRLTNFNYRQLTTCLCMQ